MNLITALLAIFLLAFLMIGAELYHSDMEQGITRDIYNYTEEIISLPLSNISESHPIVETRGIINQGRLFKIVESGINFLFVSIEQVTKMGIEYGYQNPDINWEKIFKYTIYLVIIIIAIALLKPLGYLIVFIVMLIILIRDKLKKRNVRRYNKRCQKLKK